VPVSASELHGLLYAIHELKIELTRALNILFRELAQLLGNFELVLGHDELLYA
jgi:hypothetical protein